MQGRIALRRANGSNRPIMTSPLSQDLKRNANQVGRLAMIRAAVFNPGFSAVLRYRIARRLFAAGGGFKRLIGRIVWLSNVRAFGCFISPGADIGPGLWLPHPVGIVIGDGVRIGRDVTIYQHVTFGRATQDDERYPDIADDVTIYAGAVILGPIRIGKGAVIGANAVVTRDVEAGAIAKGIPARSSLPGA